MAHDIHLTVDSKYRITSAGTRDENLLTNGTFKGYVSVGSGDGLAIELDKTHGDIKGKIRVIPSHMILSIDIIEAKAEEEAKPEETDIHYT
ncbi:MAG: hypothetical protein HY556_06760 [Euryarchaeota archaeon]|nr:hypothetical protein [Euryarchaeota archaeon]